MIITCIETDNEYFKGWCDAWDRIPFRGETLHPKLNFAFFKTIVLEAALDSSIILAHPEALIKEEKGTQLLASLQGKVGAVIVDECHKIDDW